MNSLNSKQRETLAEKAYTDNRVEYFKEAFYDLSRESVAAYAQRVIDDQRYRDYLFVFDDNLPSELMDKLAIQAMMKSRMSCLTGFTGFF